MNLSVKLVVALVIWFVGICTDDPSCPLKLKEDDKPIIEGAKKLLKKTYK